MDPGEIRYRITSVLLQAGGPQTVLRIVTDSGVGRDDVVAMLRQLVREGLVVEGDLIPGGAVPQYCWWARWEEAARHQATDSQQVLRATLGAVARVPDSALDVFTESATAFYDYVIGEYHPPEGKRFLVVLQCSVRRPFSKAPSHAPMRRAIRVATGFDPREEFETCPVHVIVLASRIGPVPYELEDLYPANVRGGGVKHFETDHYLRVRPVLAHRMAQYVITHSGHYEHVATFTEGRYAEVMQEARELVVQRCGERASFAILPQMGGTQVVRMGKSTPGPYWARYWIQLYLEIVSWLPPDRRAQAEERLLGLDVDYEERLPR